MPLHDDIRVERDFDELCKVLGRPSGLNPAQSDPIFYFVYRPENMLAVKRRLSAWMGRLTNDGFEPRRISLGDIMHELINASGRWDAWLELEPATDLADFNQAIRDVLTQDSALIEKVAGLIAEGGKRTVVLLTESEVLHPYYRTRAIESALVGRVPHPTVIFYPGRRVGQYGLHFLGFYPEDSNYRSTLVGGLD